jgi:hypothetical protein
VHAIEFFNSILDKFYKQNDIFQLLVKTLGVKTIKSIPIIPYALMMALISAVIGLIIGIIYAVIFGSIIASVPTTTPYFNFNWLSILFGVGSIIIMPILTFAAGFIGGVIFAGLYNFLAPRIGGIKLNFEEE